MSKTFPVDTRVFVKHPKKSWVPGNVRGFEQKKAHYTVQDDDGDEVSNIPEQNVTLCRDDLLDEGVDPPIHDLLFLSILHDATLLRCLRVRYMKDIIYTNIGAIVVALNPFNFKIPHYMESKMPDYLSEGEVIRNNLPHSWAVAHNTYYEMLSMKKNQCILVSGESGAGKTEACKIVMKYFGQIANMRATEEQKTGAEQIRIRILQSSPILEGFGNAKTVRNNNSSRFGKFVKIRFADSGYLSGAFTINYLLEKSRIVTASPNERVYHALYQVCKGDYKSKFGLEDAKKYRSTNAGNCTAIDGEDDVRDFKDNLESMGILGLDAETKENIWKVVAGCLTAENIELKSKDADTTVVDPKGEPFMKQACGLWGVPVEEYEKELLTTTNVMRGETVVKQHKVAQALDMRQSVTKHMYEKLFTFLIDVCNKATVGSGDEEELWIGLLDIFGFEDFEHNSFEQVCINLANESLQNHYNNYIFKRDLEECKAEGVQVDDFNCPDNTPCLKLVSDSLGVLGFLDEECTLQTGSDESMLAKITQHCGSNPFFERKPTMKSSFTIKHYAGNVTYTIGGWVEKNRDNLKDDFKLMMRKSSNPTAAELLPEPVERSGRPLTVGGFFKNQVKDLMDLINSTNPHWIRCIKPHPAKKPLMFDGVAVTNQLSSSGVLGTVKIRKAGYPVRMEYPAFLSRYKILTGKCPEGADMDVKKDYVRKAMKVSKATPREVQLGKTRVFMKSEAYFEFERCREQAGTQHRLNLQAAARATIADMVRRRKMWKRNALVIQEEFRDYLKRSAQLREIRRKQREEMLALHAKQRKAMEKEFDDGWEEGMKDLDEEFALIMRKRREEYMWLLEKKRRENDERLAFYEHESRHRVSIMREHMSELAVLKYFILPVQEVNRRRTLEAQEAHEWERLSLILRVSSADYLERKGRRLLMRLEAVARSELEERRKMLPQFFNSLNLEVRVFADVLTDVKHDAVLAAQRASHRAHVRMERHEVEFFSQRNGIDPHLSEKDVVGFDAARRVRADPSYHKTGETVHKLTQFASIEPWRGVQNVPDIDQVLSGMVDPEIDRKKIQRSDRYNECRESSRRFLELEHIRGLDATGHPSSVSPLRSSRGDGLHSGQGSFMSPGGRGSLAGTHQSPGGVAGKRDKTAELKMAGIFEKFSSHDDEMRFVRMRQVLVNDYRHLAREEPSVAKRLHMSELTIPDKRSFYIAMDKLQQEIQRVCMLIVPQLRKLNASCIANQVQEQNPVTGMWKRFTPVVKELIAEYPLCTDWKKLVEEKKRVRYAEENFRTELLKVILGCVDRGANLPPRHPVSSTSTLKEVRSCYVELLGHFGACSRCMAPMAAKSTLMQLRIRWPRMQNRTLPDRCRECSVDAFDALLHPEKYSPARTQQQQQQQQQGSAASPTSPRTPTTGHQRGMSSGIAADHHDSRGLSSSEPSRSRGHSTLS